MYTPLYFTAVGTATQRAQTTPPVSSSSNTAASTTVASSGNGGIGQHVLGAASVALGTVVGSIAPIGQPGLAQVPRPALAPSHAIQPSLLSQRLVLTSQAQARLPSKWPPLPLPLPLPLHLWHHRMDCSALRASLGALLICVYCHIHRLKRAGSTAAAAILVTEETQCVSHCSHISSISTASAFSNFFLETCMNTMNEPQNTSAHYLTRLLCPPSSF